ncbi:linamarin synthase 2-like [Diospyros lotus]|uniref:linamarin synthase 2-like n=1 Tax=Diospyros lotus TaxID=55363 RepID=UPI0022505630|nr:linamarin synthase 2-like [Diospyros lotus]
MATKPAQQPHVLCVPLPAQGHINPFMQLAKLLHSRGFFITFVNTEFNHRRLLRSKGTDEWAKGSNGFRFETMSEGLPPSDRDATQDPVALCEAVMNKCLDPFRQLLRRLYSSEEASPPVTCIVADGVMNFAVRAAEEFGIPGVHFWTASACGLMGYIQYSELTKRGIFPFKDENFMNDGTLETPIDWVPGMHNIRLRDFPSFVRTTDPDDFMFYFLGESAQNCFKGSAIIFNTFDALEHQVLQAISSQFPRIYTAGPLSLLQKQLTDDQTQTRSQVHSLHLSLWKEDTRCLQWLDQREPNSVVYVNYGCVTVMSEEHLKEFAWGLANSKVPFLWIVRPDIVMGESAKLPPDFVEDIEGRGLLASWCPQEQVLLHPSVGVFLTHCGWNSMTESVCGGVPMICWPYFAEQQTNCRYACSEWGIAAEVDQDVNRHEVERIVRETVQGESGRKMREKAVEWKRKAEEATAVGGSSYCNFDRFVDEALLSCVTGVTPAH